MELQLIREFQNRVSDLMLTDDTCIRFLRARELDLDKAEVMIRNNFKWRREVKVENLYMSEAPEFIKSDISFRYTGISKNGGPVFVLPMGFWKARYWIENGQKEEVILHSYRVLESVLIKMTEMNNNQSILICDMEGLTYYKVAHADTLRVAYGGFQTLEQNYPEILQNLIVVNAPWVFTIGFNFIKPILSPKTLNKIQVYGSDKKTWMSVLRQLCTENAIPQEYMKN